MKDDSQFNALVLEQKQQGVTCSLRQLKIDEQ